MQSLNVKAHPERSTWNHSLGSCFTTFSCLCGSASGRQRSCHLIIIIKKSMNWERKPVTLTQVEKESKRSDGITKLTLTWTTLFLRFDYHDAPERSGRGDTFSSAKTPLVIHIKTEGRAAEVEKEKSHWCGTNSFGAFPFFFISLKQTQGHFDGK